MDNTETSTNSPLEPTVCPDCDGITRRDFLKGVGGLALAASVGAAPAFATPRRLASPPPPGPPENLVKMLYDGLTPRQRPLVALPWDDARRSMVQANWAVVQPSIAELFDPDQQALVNTIFQGVTAPDWHDKFARQMQDDAGGIGSYHVALFGDPDGGKFEWVMTGRHMTRRCSGHSVENVAFGGPIFYGHAVVFNEKPDHPGNVFWYQAKRANEVFQALDGHQRGEALIARAPVESAISFRHDGAYPGIAVGDLSRDQQQLVHEVMHDILAPFRPSDVKEVLRELKESGGLQKIHLAFYKQGDLGNDGVWDIWRLEGPSFVWHFRGAPHVHTWVNIAGRSV